MKKGFTLIELLAVIVILAIIAVIAVPIVLNIINDTKESATLRSADFYVGALQNELALENMKLGGSLSPSRCTIKADGNAKCDGVLLNVKIEGEEPNGGVITFEEGKVKSVKLTYKNGSVSTDDKGEFVYIKGSLQDFVNQKYEEYQKKVENGSTDVQNKTAHMYVSEALAAKNLDGFDVVLNNNGRMVIGASSIAKKLFDAGVPIGAKVNGYDISGNPTSYTTDGKEFTFIDDGNIGDADPMPQTVNVANDVSWTFMGVSEDGEALIVFDLDDDTVQDADASAVYSTMRIGGAGGYNNGVSALNTVCDKLYSTSKGKARSINYDDVLFVLDYDGPISQYTNEGTETKLDTIKTIEEFYEDDASGLKRISGNANGNIFTPDGTDILKHKVNYLWIKKDVDAKYIKGTEEAVKIAFLGGIPGGTNGLDINYWIADRSIRLSYKKGSGQVDYGIRRGNGTNISAYTLTYAWTSTSNIIGAEKGSNGKVVLRPVVELNDDLIFTYTNNVLTLN